MLCARVMRGSSSRAKSVTPRAAISPAACGLPSGSHRPMTTCPARSRGRSARPACRIGPGGADLEEHVGGEDFVAAGHDFRPLGHVLLVGKPAARPAPVSTSTSNPALVKPGKRPGPGHAVFARKRLAGNSDNHGHSLGRDLEYAGP